MSSKESLAQEIVDRPFYVDGEQPGVVRGGFFDEMGGMLIGLRAPYVALALNEHAQLVVDGAVGPQ